jgi:hypothetical protein
MMLDASSSNNLAPLDVPPIVTVTAEYVSYSPPTPATPEHVSYSQPTPAIAPEHVVYSPPVPAPHALPSAVYNGDFLHTQWSDEPFNTGPNDYGWEWDITGPNDCGGQWDIAVNQTDEPCSGMPAPWSDGQHAPAEPSPPTIRLEPVQKPTSLRHHLHLSPLSAYTHGPITYTAVRPTQRAQTILGLA